MKTFKELLDNLTEAKSLTPKEKSLLDNIVDDVNSSMEDVMNQHGVNFNASDGFSYIIKRLQAYTK